MALAAWSLVTKFLGGEGEGLEIEAFSFFGHSVFLAVIQELGVPGRHKTKDLPLAVLRETSKWTWRIKTAGVAPLTRAERAEMDKARGRNSAKKANIRANGTAHEKMVLKMTENYNHDGFINHNRMLKNAFKAYRQQHPGVKTDHPDVQAEVRKTVGSAPSTALESRARDIIKKDLPLLMEKPGFQWATDPAMILRTKQRSGMTKERVDAASADIKAARKGRDALILRLLSQLSEHWVPKLPVEWQTLRHTVSRSWETQT